MRIGLMIGSDRERSRAGRLDGLVTDVQGAAPFYAAENYHQQYFERNGGQPYCQFVVAPKVAKFKKEFVDRLKR